MRYIISSQPLHFLQQFEIPKKDNYGNLDLDTFYNSIQGQKFREIKPLVLNYIKERKDLSFQIAMDISWISLCYNCDLYIYIMSDNCYFSMLDLGFHSYKNFGKSAELQRLGQQYGNYNFPGINDLKIDINTTYYKGDLQTIEDVVNENIKSINLRKRAIWGYKLSVNNGFNMI